MRKFRGMTKEGKWVYGWYFQRGKDSYIINDSGFDYPSVQIDPNSYPILMPSLTENQFIEVLPETVGQSTGLKDKNNKPIYEGDIVHIWSNFYGKDMPVAEVFWNEKNATFDTKQPNGLYHNWLPNTHRQGWFIEVIGNIYENPKLLGEQK